jgi:hypothetical protein
MVTYAQKFKKCYYLNRQCAAMLVVLMGHDVIFTLFWPTLQLKITFEGWGWRMGKGRLPLGQVSCRTPADFAVWHSLVIKYDISPHGCQIC